jgi:hypothetical protein
MNTTEAKDGINPILVEIKRDTRSILDDLASGIMSRSAGDTMTGTGRSEKSMVDARNDKSAASIAASERAKNRKRDSDGRFIRESPVAATPPVAVASPVAVTPPVAVASPVAVTPPVVAAVAQLIETASTQLATKKKRAAVESKGREAFKAETENQQGQGVVNATLTQPRIGGMDEAGHGPVISSDVKETAGLALLGPVTGAISEIAGLGSSLKDTITGIAGKFRGKKSTGDKKVDAQISATAEVRTAVEESDRAQEERNAQLIRAITQLNPDDDTTTEGSAGQLAHADATAPDTAIRNIFEQGNGTSAGGRAAHPTSGGLFSRIRENVTGNIASGAANLLRLPVVRNVALGVVGTVATSAAVVSIIDSVSKNYNDTKGQKEDFALKEGETLNPFLKALYAITGGKSEKSWEDKTDEEKANTKTGVLAKTLSALHSAEQAILNATIDMLTGGKGLPSTFNVAFTKVGNPNAPAQSTPASPTPVQPMSADASPAQSTPASRATVPRKKDDYQYAGLGSLAEHHESRGDVGAVAPDAKKGFAYGKFQMHSGGTVGDFIKQSPWAKDFEGMKPGSKEYNEQWPKTAAKNPEAFGQAQFDFIKKTHYGPTERKAKKMGIDTTDPMLQEVLFSTGVQHGPRGGPQILDQAFPKGVDPKTLTREQIRERVYAERGRKNADGTLAHFPSLEGGIKAHNKQGNRFINENKDAAKIGALSSSTVTSKIGQPTEQNIADVAGPEAVPASSPATIQQAPVTQPIPIASSQQQPLSTPSPIIQPKPEPQPVVIAGGGGQERSGPANSGSQSPGGFQFAQKDMRPNPPRQQSQPQKKESIIPIEFNDILLTLMAHDLM